MSRIQPQELEQLKEVEANCLKTTTASYKAFKAKSNIPDPSDEDGINLAAAYLTDIFFEEEFDLFDVVVGERGFLLASEDDTHYRGRVLEAVLNGSFSGESKKDFAWGELKLIETKPNDHTKMDQIMTCGVIFTKSKGEYSVTEDYQDSKFLSKMKKTLLVSYFKAGKQLGCLVNNIAVLDVQDPEWASRLQEDWEYIRDVMKTAIEGEKNGTVIRKASGITKSDSEGRRTPNGLLGIRSDSVTITNKFFKEILGNC